MNAVSEFRHRWFSRAPPRQGRELIDRSNELKLVFSRRRLQFQYSHLNEVQKRRHRHGKNGVMLVIDPMSYQYLVGAVIDYTDGLEGSQFVIKNPNATSTCGCGSSFAA
jgi:iron-sulfur cluster insertion protein